MEFVVGGADMDDYLPLLEEELALARRRSARADVAKDDVAPDATFRVVDHRRGHVGHRSPRTGCSRPASPFVVIEKNADVGGTWFENTYPGCRVDVPNHFYSYSFAQRHDWPQYFSTAGRAARLLPSTAPTSFGLRDHIRFGTEVRRGERGTTTQHAGRSRRATADGAEETLDANAIVSAVGQLNRPQLPDIPGVERFAGPSFHSARWDHDVDLAGKRVAVIGTGASAVQFVPEIADEAEQLHVFQRTPPWLGADARLPRAGARRAALALRARARLREWYRFWMFWRMGDGLLPGGAVDPEWADRPRAVSAANDVMRDDAHGATSSTQFADRPDLLAAGHARRTRPAPSACCATTASGPARSSATTSRSSPTRIARDHRRRASSPTTASSTRST